MFSKRRVTADGWSARSVQIFASPPRPCSKSCPLCPRKLTLLATLAGPARGYRLGFGAIALSQSRYFRLSGLRSALCSRGFFKAHNHLPQGRFRDVGGERGRGRFDVHFTPGNGYLSALSDMSALSYSGQSPLGTHCSGINFICLNFISSLGFPV